MEGKFLLHRVRSAYLVKFDGIKVTVNPAMDLLHVTMDRTIATSLQVLGNAELIKWQPKDPLHHLKEYYRSKGWKIEEVE